MFLRSVVGLIAVLFCVSSVNAVTFTVKPEDTGMILVWHQKTGAWAAVKEMSTLSIKDSLYLDDQRNATLQFGNGCTVLLKGELRATIAGSDSAVVIILDQGQLFINRSAGAEFSNIKFIVRNCQFTPIGTAAAVKFTKQGEPTVAVLNGKMRIDSPKGSFLVVNAGSFGTYEAINGGFAQGTLPPEAIAGLEKWSGVKQESAATAAAPQSPATAPAAVTPAVAPVSAAVTPQATPQATTQTTTPATTPAASAAPQQSLAKTTESKTAAQASAAPAQPAAKVAESKQASEPAATSSATAASAASAAPTNDSKKDTASAKPAEENKDQKSASAGGSGASGGTPGTSWELSVGSVTVDGKQWTRLAISPDIPIWKFGVCLDLEMFIDAQGNFSNKGWQFSKDSALQSVLRKIRYIRFGHENEPVFAKVGALSNVTFGYGFIVNNFTNMLHYPDQKLIGAQFYLNDISPIGVTLQTMVADFNDFNNNGGVVAGRLAVEPLKLAKMPILSNLSIGATYGVDLNQYADARTWQSNSTDSKGLFYTYYLLSQGDKPATIADLVAHGQADTGKDDATYRDSVSKYAVFGLDAGLPLIKSDFFGLDVYGQTAVVADTAMLKSTNTGWGFGAPGVALHAGPFHAQVEYRHIRGKFIPGYFDQYYLDERLQRYGTRADGSTGPLTRSQTVTNQALDGIFGMLGCNISDMLVINGMYQYLMGKSDTIKDQRFEISGGLGEALIKRIPKLTKAEVYLYKTNIGSTVIKYDTTTMKNVYDGFFDETPSMYYGYRVGVEITKGASLIWDARFGYKWDANKKLVPDNNICVETAVTF